MAQAAQIPRTVAKGEGVTDLPSSGRMDGRTHVLPVRVYYEDTDFSGVVYHANYLKFFERGRSDLLRLSGFSHRRMAAEADPAAFVVTRIEIDFLRPARIDDALVVETCVNRLRGPRIFFSQRLLRDGEPICRAEVSAAAIHSDGRIRRPAAEEAAIWKRLLPE